MNKTIELNNRYEILSDELEDEDSIDNQYEIVNEQRILQQKIPKQGKTAHTHKEHGEQKKHKTNTNTEAFKTTYIVGDSMLKHIDCHRLRRSVKDKKKKIYAETYRGATVDAMQHYIKPCLQRNPDEIIPPK